MEWLETLHRLIAVITSRKKKNENSFYVVAYNQRTCCKT